MSSEQASYVDTEIEEVEKPYQEKVDNTNTVSLVKKIDKIAKRQILPENMNEMTEFEEMKLQDTHRYGGFLDPKKPGTGKGERKRDVKVRPLGGNLGGMGGQKGSALQQVAALKNKYLHLNDGSSSEGGM